MLTPAFLVHLHLLLNHFPTVGMVVGFGVLLLGIAQRSEELKRGSLAVLFAIALISLPTYMTGYSAQKAVRRAPGVSMAVIDYHQRSALFALIFMEATGIVAWYGLYRARGRMFSVTGNTAAVVVLSLVTLGLMTVTANIGGEIRHPEIVADTATVATIGTFAPAFLASDFITRYHYRHAWAWKTLETLHFMGLCLLFGVVLVGNLRLMG